MSVENILCGKLFDGSFLPHCIMSRNSKEISDGAKILYARLFKYRGNNEYAFPKRSKLSEDLGKCDRQIDRLLSELENLKLIKSVQRGKKRSNIYYFLNHPWISSHFKSMGDSTYMSTHNESDSTHMSTPCDSTHMSTPYEVNHILNKSPLNICEVSEIFEHWKKVMQKSRAKLDQKRERKINQALVDYSVEDLKSAIDGCARTAYNMGQNPDGKLYDDIELILRDASHIERFISNNVNKIIPTEKPSSGASMREGIRLSMERMRLREETNDKLKYR